MEQTLIFITVIVFFINIYGFYSASDKRMAKIIELTDRAAKIELENLQKHVDRMQRDIDIILNAEEMYTTAEQEAIKPPILERGYTIKKSF